MRQLAIDAGQSCHLALHSRGEMVVVARMESREQLGFAVRVGHRRTLSQAALGVVLYAFQPVDGRQRWESLFVPALTRSELAAFQVHAEQVRQREVELTPSRFVGGMTDISAEGPRRRRRRCRISPRSIRRSVSRWRRTR